MCHRVVTRLMETFGHAVRGLDEIPRALDLDDLKDRPGLNGIQDHAVATRILVDDGHPLHLDGPICLSQCRLANETHQGPTGQSGQHGFAHSTFSHHFVHRRQG